MSTWGFYFREMCLRRSNWVGWKCVCSICRFAKYQHAIYNLIREEIYFGAWFFKDNQRRLISLNLTYSGVFIKGFPNYHSLSEPVPEHINESGVGKHFTFMCYIAGLLHTDMPAWMRIHSTPNCAQIASWRIVIQLAIHWKLPRHLQNKPRQARHDCVYTTWW